MSERQFPLPPCEKLKYLRRLKHSLSNGADGGNGSAGVNLGGCPSFPYDPNAPSFWDGPAWLSTSCHAEQVVREQVQASIVNLGRSYTGRGLTAQTYTNIVLPNDGVAHQVLSGDPTRRFIAIIFTGQDYQFALAPEQVSSALGFTCQGSYIPFIFDDATWGAWTTYPLWAFHQSTSLIPMQIWTESYVSWRSPSLQ